MILETERLILRELTMNDLACLYEILSDPVSMRYYDHPFSWEESERWIQWNLDNYAALGFGLWGVTLKESGLLIGDCGITMQDIDGKQEPEIGYHIKRRYANQGYATEAARACRNYAFDVLGLPHVYSYMKAANIASARVAEKNGMRLLKEIDKKGKTRIYRITFEEYQKTTT